MIRELGDRLSDRGADLAAHPFAQAALLALSAGWIAAGAPIDALTLALSILAITLSQMVLNRQSRREADDRARDEAMHAKLDELIHGVPQADDGLAGIEG